jgi:hypothetical protein
MEGRKLMDELESPVYPEIDKVMSFYGFEIDDLAMLLILFWIVETIVGQARPRLGSVDLTLYLTILATGVLFAGWRGFKNGKPRHLLEDTLGLLAEPEALAVTCDDRIRPAYLIEPEGQVAVAQADHPRCPREMGRVCA